MGGMNEGSLGGTDEIENVCEQYITREKWSINLF